jgi:predicted PurR-regulated permease PerM
MLGLDARAAKAAWTVFLVALAIFTVYEARGPIVVFVLALFFAYLIAPAVDFSMRHVARGKSKALALAVVYVLMVGILVAIGAALAGKIAEEAANLATQLPQYMTNQDPLAALPFPGWLEPLREKIIVAARDQLKNLDEAALPLIRGALTQVLSQAGNALTAILIPILAFFFLKDGHELRSMIVGLAHSHAQKDFLNRVLDGLDQLLAKYIRALIGLSLSTLIFYTLYFQITGVRYALLLGGLSAILEFIPVVGPLVASATVLIVAGASGYEHLTWIIVFLVVFRLFQDYVLSPYLMGQGVELHPLLVLFGVLAGEKIAGIPGMFFSVPVIAALRILFLEITRPARTESIVAEDSCDS